MNLKGKPTGAVHTHITAQVQKVRMLIPGHGFKPQQGMQMVETTVYTVRRSKSAESPE